MIVEGHDAHRWGRNAKPWDEEEAETPFVEVKLYDERVTEESVPKIIEAMTEALAELEEPPASTSRWSSTASPQVWHRRKGAGRARPAGAPGTTASVSRACRRVVLTISFARAKLSSSVGTGPTARPSA